ncbi:protein kinase [bacterium]|nr:protein kinase [bacterium]
MNQEPLSEEQIFEAALAINSEVARKEYLRQVCQDDNHVARIEALLKAGTSNGSFLKTHSAFATADDQSSQVPRRIGDFEILGELGRGGMGVVYRARQCSLNRLVALKVLSSALGISTKAIMRFKLEAEAAAKLHHTNIVPIYWTGEENRVPYYAMELVDGPSLDRVLKELRAEADSTSATVTEGSPQQDQAPNLLRETLLYKPSLDKIADIQANGSSSTSSSSLTSDSNYFDKLASMMADVADALAHAHDHGVVHRDIKPANLLLSSDGRLSINDFGLARMLEQPGMTMTGELMGSPMYMSPEQITAGRLPLDHRTDIYSLGATLYEMLTLHPPFPGKQRDQVLSQVLHKDPPSPRSLNPNIPRDLETICLKAMEKDPDQRYQTAEHMAKDLRCFVNRNSISARRTSVVEKGMRWVRKNKAISSLAVVVLLICLGVGAREYWRSRETWRKEVMIAAHNAILNRDTETAEAQKEILIDLDGTTIESDLIKYEVDLLKGEAKTVVEQLQAKIEQDPRYASDVRIQSLLTQAFVSSGDWAEYANQSRRLISLEPKTAEEKYYKARVLIFADFEETTRLLDDAFAGMSGYGDFWITKAEVGILRAIARGRTDSIDPLKANPDERLIDLALRLDEIDEADRDTTHASKICGDDVYMVWNCRLYALLTRSHLYRMMQRCEIDNGDQQAADDYAQQAEKCLDNAEVLMKKIAKWPISFMGNFNRFYYYDLRINYTADDLDPAQRENYLKQQLNKMELVLEDAERNGQVGWLSDPYWAYLLKTKQYDYGLEKLASVTQDNYAISRRVMFELSRAGENGPVDLNKIDAKLKAPVSRRGIFTTMLLGNHAEAKAFYQKRREVAIKGTYDYAICRYMLGELNADEFIDQVKKTEYDLVTAYFTLGFEKLISGERQKALEYFRKASNSTMYHWTTFVNARTYAAKLDPESPYYDLNWPAWLAEREQPVEKQAGGD